MIKKFDSKNKLSMRERAINAFNTPYEVDVDVNYAVKPNKLVTYKNNDGVDVTISGHTARRLAQASKDAIKEIMPRYGIFNNEISINDKPPFHIETKGANKIIDAKQNVISGSEYSMTTYSNGSGIPKLLRFGGRGIIKYSIKEKTVRLKIKTFFTNLYYKLFPKETARDKALKAFNRKKPYTFNEIHGIKE